MASTKYLKNGKVQLTLSPDEFDVLYECLSRCKDCMQWNELENVADDGERFLWEIDDYKVFRTLQDLDI